MSDHPLHEFDPAFGKRREFGELTRASGRALNDRAFAQLDGAINLLSKAVARLDAGEDESAERLIARAAASPYSEYHAGSPGVRGAQQILYELVSDQLESSDEDDSTWLTVTIEVHSHLGGPGRVDLESSVHGFFLQRDLFELSASEERLIRKTFGHAPLEADLGDGLDTTAEERVVIIRSLLDASRALHAAYAQRTG
jgi:hypothetical protein